MRYLAAMLATVVLVSCASANDPAGSEATLVPTEPPSAPATTLTTQSLTTTTTVAPEPTRTPDLGDSDWIGREVELRLPPGGEGVEYGFDPHNMQTVVWVEGEPTDLWTWSFVGFIDDDGQPAPFFTAVIGEGPDPHAMQWEEEANQEFPLPPVEPIEPGTLNDVSLWVIRWRDDLADASGAIYTVLDARPVRLAEDSGTWLGQAYYRGWEFGGEPIPRLFGWGDWIGHEEASDLVEDDPVPAVLVFELVGTGDDLHLVSVDPTGAHFGWPDPSGG